MPELRPYKFRTPDKPQALEGIEGFHGQDVIALSQESEYPVVAPPKGSIRDSEFVYLYSLRQNTHVRTFDMEDEADRETYEKLITASRSLEWVHVYDKEVSEVAPGKWKILVEWAEIMWTPRERGLSAFDGQCLE